jgi:hypothetical protein
VSNIEKSILKYYNVNLAQLNTDFESPWVFGAIQGPPCCEARFHIFPMEVHLYTLTLTQNPHYIPICITHVAIPNRLLNLTEGSYPLQQCTLGQRFIDGMRDPQPPLHPWEWSMMWVHSEWRMIKKLVGRREGMGGLGNFAFSSSFLLLGKTGL